MNGESPLEIGMSKRITDYESLRERIPCLVRELKDHPASWLDAGCGTGGSVRLSVELFPDTRFTLSDPSEENISAVKERFSGSRFVHCCAATDQLTLKDASFDVITSILSNHYYGDRAAKLKALSNCHRMLSDGGVMVIVEHRRSEDQEKADSEWRSYMESRGLSETSIQEMFDRRGTVYFPYTEEDLKAILGEAGFTDAVTFWATCSDIGLVCRK